MPNRTTPTRSIHAETPVPTANGKSVKPTVPPPTAIENAVVVMAAASPALDKIVVKGAREHNLKNIDCEIPKNKLVIFTGLSGSGKSSLAFDTIYAEGQRRYVESLSSYARQFLGIMEKPDVDLIEGLSPAISIDQKSTSHNPRSTVGTITEIYDYMRLLFARVGHPHCPICGREISHQSIDQMVDAVFQMAEKANPKIGYRAFILAPIVKDRKGEFTQLLEDLRKKGYTRARIDGKIVGLDDDISLIKTNKHSIDAIVDRLVLSKVTLENGSKGFNPDMKSRVSQALEQALKLGEGFAVVSEIKDAAFEMPTDPKEMEDHLFSERFACPIDNISIPEIEPRSFSFNSPHGACPKCMGLGTILEVDPELVFNMKLSIAEGGILPWGKLFAHDSWFGRMVEQVARKLEFSMHSPIGQLSKEVQEFLLLGSDEVQLHTKNFLGMPTGSVPHFEGIIPNLTRRYKETESDYIRSEIEKYMRFDVCPECHGARLKPQILGITVDDRSIVDVTKVSIEHTEAWINSLMDESKPTLSSRERIIGRPILKEIQSRLRFLLDVGLGYLTLNRTAHTLSGGEAQRIRLASQIGSGLSGVLYVLDEPTIGLHERDNDKLITTLKRLRDIGNTVVVVEHDQEMMEQSDYIFDFGPGAGEHGGNIIAKGTPEEIKHDENSLTGKYLSGKKKVEVAKDTFKKKVTIHAGQAVASTDSTDKAITVYGAKENNLKDISVAFPLGKLVCVTGVSGSGKSTLVNEVLHKAIAQELYHSKDKPGKHDGITGFENIDKVILIDQSPIGRTPRSNPATYTGVFTPIREIFAKSTEAKIRGYNMGRFSFNVKGGRCEACQGEGQIRIEMQFLPDVYVDCEVCNGKRYNREALEILYKEKNIADVLDMTVEEALEFFKSVPQIHGKLETLFDVGLGYIRLGQPAPTLSGGEAQRVKLASELSRRSTGKTLYILDEPTTGLHFADIEKLLHVLKRLVHMGNTITVIEHNMDIIKNADWIIDLGPEGGDGGGQIIATGTPEQIAADDHSYTGQYLKKSLIV